MIPYIKPTTESIPRDMEFAASDIPATLILDDNGNIGTTTIPVYYLGYDSSRKTEVLDEYGNAFTFSSERKALPIFSPCKIRVIKPTTTEEIGIVLCNYTK